MSMITRTHTSTLMSLTMTIRSKTGTLIYRKMFTFIQEAIEDFFYYSFGFCKVCREPAHGLCEDHNLHIK
jgi:hypothetical protein